jgi:hypothetical protein
VKSFSPLRLWLTRRLAISRLDAMTVRLRLAVLAVVSLLALGAGLMVPHLRPATSEAAVSRLQYFLGCKDGRASVTLLWSGGDPTARLQWVDLSAQNNGWLSGTFSGAGPFASDVASYDWTGLASKSRYFVRFNQLLQNNSWDTSATYYIDTIDCTPRN